MRLRSHVLGHRLMQRARALTPRPALGRHRVLDAHACLAAGECRRVSAPPGGESPTPAFLDCQTGRLADLLHRRPYARGARRRFEGFHLAAGNSGLEFVAGSAFAPAACPVRLFAFRAPGERRRRLRTETRDELAPERRPVASIPQAAGRGAQRARLVQSSCVNRRHLEQPFQCGLRRRVLKRGAG